MPANERLGSDHNQGVAPVEQVRQQDEGYSSYRVDTSRRDAAFGEEGELSAQEQVFGFDGPGRAEGQPDPAKDVSQ